MTMPTAGPQMDLRRYAMDVARQQTDTPYPAAAASPPLYTQAEILEAQQYYAAAQSRQVQANAQARAQELQLQQIQHLQQNEQQVNQYAQQHAQQRGQTPQQWFGMTPAQMAQPPQPRSAPTPAPHPSHPSPIPYMHPQASPQTAQRMAAQISRLAQIPPQLLQQYYRDMPPMPPGTPR
jgi:hypothetical protein